MPVSEVSRATRTVGHARRTTQPVDDKHLHEPRNLIHGLADCGGEEDVDVLATNDKRVHSEEDIGADGDDDGAHTRARVERVELESKDLLVYTPARRGTHLSAHALERARPSG